MGFLGEDVAMSTLYFLQQRSGMTLENLVDVPGELILALRHLFGLGSVLIFDSIRKELLLPSADRSSGKGRIDELLSALKVAKESVEAGVVA
jgi:hypothetical protein